MFSQRSENTFVIILKATEEAYVGITTTAHHLTSRFLTLMFIRPLLLLFLFSELPLFVCFYSRSYPLLESGHLSMFGITSKLQRHIQLIQVNTSNIFFDDHVQVKLHCGHHCSCSSWSSCSIMVIMLKLNFTAVIIATVSPKNPQQVVTAPFWGNSSN